MDDVRANEEWSLELDSILDELCYRVDSSGITIGKGRNKTVNCMKLTLDPIRAEYRPLIFYVVSLDSIDMLILIMDQVVYLLQMFVSLTFRRYGYIYHTGSRHNQQPSLGYWYKPSLSTSDEPPILIIHGIGSVLSLMSLVILVAKSAPYRHVFILETRHVSMLFPHPSRFPSPAETVAQVYDILDYHLPRADGNSPPQAVIFSHSLGSIISVWLLEFAPERLAGLVLCEPISLLLQYSDVAYNFVYRKGTAAAEIFFEWIAREPGIALTLARHFHWFQNVFPFILEENHKALNLKPQLFPRHIPISIFLSQQDCIVPSSRIVSVIGEGRKENLSVQIMKGMDHGSFLFDRIWLKKIVVELISIGCR